MTEFQQLEVGDRIEKRTGMWDEYEIVGAETNPFGDEIIEFIVEPVADGADGQIRAKNTDWGGEWLPLE